MMRHSALSSSDIASEFDLQRFSLEVLLLPQHTIMSASSAKHGQRRRSNDSDPVIRVETLGSFCHIHGFYPAPISHFYTASDLIQHWLPTVLYVYSVVEQSPFTKASGFVARGADTGAESRSERSLKQLEYWQSMEQDETQRTSARQLEIALGLRVPLEEEYIPMVNVRPAVLSSRLLLTDMVCGRLRTCTLKVTFRQGLGSEAGSIVPRRVWRHFLAPRS